MSVGQLRSVDQVIADEQDYLFQGQQEELQSPTWSMAACAAADPEIFFPVSVQDRVSRSRALSYCNSCVIARECLTLALRDRTIVGIWGGTDEIDRARVRGTRESSQRAE